MTRTILLAALLLAPLPGAAETLSPAEIRSEIVGREWSGRMGMLRASLIYAPDGTLSMRSALGTGGGTWALSDGGICVDVTSGQRQGRQCLTFTARGDGSYDVSNGMRLVPEG